MLTWPVQLAGNFLLILKDLLINMLHDMKITDRYIVFVNIFTFCSFLHQELTGANVINENHNE